jgi:N-acetylglutamate synthase-like GNAT family acetyltransferase
MDLVIEAARPDEWAAVFSFLETMGLPTAGLADHLSGVLVSRAGRRIVGTAALEVYGKAALLRSVAVSEDRRGRGLGTALVQRALELGRQQGVENFYLLTETAQGFFARLGFRVIPRSAVPAPVRASAEFRGACPETAVVMSLSGGCRD